MSEETSLREDIEATMQEMSVVDSEPTTAPEPAPEPVEAAPEPVAEEAAPVARERDAGGRFTSKKAAAPAGAADAAVGVKPAEKAAPPVPPSGPPVPAAPVVTPSAPTDKAPQSWTPAARETWGKLPPEARQEVLRREKEHARFMQEVAPLRREAEGFRQAMAPFENHLRAQGLEPVRAVQGLLQTEYALRTAAPAQRAQIIANLIGGYGVSIELLDQTLAGQPVSQGHQPQAPMQDPRVDQLMARLEQAEVSRKSQLLDTQRAFVEEFSQDKEFFEDVREDVADILEMAARRKQSMSLADAYERATALRPDLQKILQQREAAKSAATAQAATQRAKAASSSVPSRPAMGPPRSNEGNSLRDDIMESLREMQGR